MAERTINFEPYSRGSNVRYPLNRRVFNRFIRAGFTREEAAFAATMGYDLGYAPFRKIIKKREERIRWFMEEEGYTLEQAIQVCSDHLKSTLESELGTDRDLIPFYEMYEYAFA